MRCEGRLRSAAAAVSVFLLNFFCLCWDSPKKLTYDDLLFLNTNFYTSVRYQWLEIKISQLTSPVLWAYNGANVPLIGVMEAAVYDVSKVNSGYFS